MYLYLRLLQLQFRYVSYNYLLRLSIKAYFQYLVENYLLTQKVKSEFQKQLITGGVLVKKVFFEISQNLQENTGVFHSGRVRVSFFIKLLPQTCNFIKRRLWHRCFKVNFAKFLGIPFLQSTSG